MMKFTKFLGHYARISLRIVDAKQKVIFDRIMRYQ